MPARRAGGEGDLAAAERPGSEQSSRGRLLPWLVWAVGVLFVIFKFFNQSSYGLLSFGIADTFKLTLRDVGWLGSVYTLSYAFVTILAGSLLDQYGSRRMLAAGLLLISAGAGVSAMAQSLAWLVLGQALMGAGGSFGFPGLAYLVREQFGALRFGIVFGVAQTFAAFAGGFLQQLAGRLVDSLSWREFLVIQAIAGIPLLAAILLVVRPVAGGAGADASARSAAGVALRLRRVLGSGAVLQAAFMSGVTYSAIASVGIVWGTRLLQSRGFDTAEANSISAMIWIGIGAGAPVIALLSSAIGSHLRAALLFSFGAFLAVNGIIAFDGLSAGECHLLFLAFGFFGGGASVSGYTMVAEAVDGPFAGSAFSVVTFAGFALSGIVLAVPGYMIDAGLIADIEQAFRIYPVMLTAMVVVLALARWRRLQA